MSEPYNKPPLKEAICEIRLSLEQDLSPEQIETFYEKISLMFPEKTKGQNFFVRSGPSASNPEQIEIEQKIESFDRFLNKETKTNLHITNSGVISIHQLEPYRSWEDFFPKIKEVYSIFSEMFEFETVNRLGLRYINEIVIPSEDFKLENYFNYDLNFPIEDKITSQQLNLVFVLNELKDKINVKISEIFDSSEEDKKFILDLDCYSSTFKSEVPFEVFEWCDSAHEQVEKYFESIISQQTKDLFN